MNKRLVDAAQKYQTVVRLKGGDPMLFERDDEEILMLKAASIAVEVVPGITAALADVALNSISGNFSWQAFSKTGKSFLKWSPWAKKTGTTII